MESAFIGLLFNPFVLLGLALWTIPWKAVALWRAAQARERKWFVALLLVNTLALLEILYIFVFSKKRKG
ncbi:MAG: DUF5652 family protein [bacterium]|nr:DUF5652 family protein [bacterium]